MKLKVCKNMKRVAAARKNMRRSIANSCRLNHKSIRASKSANDMLEYILLSKEAYIQEWSNNYTGQPNTSWDNIFDNVVTEFELYAGDEASAEMDKNHNWGKTLEEQYYDGEISAEDVENAFDSWVMWKDLAEYDY